MLLRLLLSKTVPQIGEEFGFALMNPQRCHLWDLRRRLSASSGLSRNFSASAIQAWGEKQFFGPSIEQWPKWQTVGGVGGWAGLAAAGEKLRIEVGAVRWRTEGWVALRATADAWLKTKPLKLTANQSCPQGVMATINLRGRGTTTVELARADGKLLPTHSDGSSA